MKLGNKKCSKLISLVNNEGDTFIRSYCCHKQDPNIYTYNYIYNNTDEFLSKFFSIIDMRVCKGYCLLNNSTNNCLSIIDPIKDCNILMFCMFKHCNYKCKRCPSMNNRCDNKNILSKELEIKLFLKIMESLKSYNNIDTIYLSGSGEITTYDTESIIDSIIDNKNIKQVQIYSNGSNLEKLNNITDKLENSGIKTMVMISLHSLKKEIYKSITGVDTLNTILYNLEHLNCKDIIISYVMFEENMNEYIDIFDFVNKHNFKMYLAPDQYNENIKKNFHSLIKLDTKYSNIYKIEGY